MTLRSIRLIVFSITSFMLACNVSAGESLIAETFKAQGEKFVLKGNPIATDNYHDISNFEMNSSQGFPNKDFKLRFNGAYKYFSHKELTQEAILKIEINWGDGKTDEYLPQNYPFEASHKFGVKWVEDYGLGIGTWRITVHDETTYNIQIKMTTHSGTVFTSNVAYTIHMNDSGFGSPTGAKNIVKDYWRNDDCIMINNICYLQEIRTHSQPKKDVPINLAGPDFWKKGKYTHYEGVLGIEKPNPCSSPWVIVNGRCRKTNTIPGNITLIDTVKFSTPVYAEPAPWLQFLWVPSPEIFNLTLTQKIPAERQYLFNWAGTQSTKDCSESLSSYTFSYDVKQKRYLFMGNCLHFGQFEGCADNSQSPTLFEGNYYCSIGREAPKETYEYDLEWEKCNNKPALNHSKDNSGNISVQAKFECYSSITVKKTCKDPYLHRNGRCEWDEIINTPIYDETSTTIPKDTYGHEL